MTCSTCKYWKPITTAAGLCRRYPPKPVAIQERDERGNHPPIIMHVSPETPPGYVCGEWR